MIAFLCLGVACAAGGESRFIQATASAASTCAGGEQMTWHHCAC